MAKERFERKKPHVNVGTIGHADHGKTTLTAAITKTLARTGQAQSLAYDQLDQAPAERAAHGVSIAAARVEYETATRHYAHIDCPGLADYAKTLITGAAQMDGAILVISAAEGPQRQTREHLFLARQLGVPAVVVFLNKVDLLPGADLQDLLVLEVRELLSEYGFSGENTPIIAGSALRALEGDETSDIGGRAVTRLLEAVDHWIPAPPRELDKPFLMAVDDVFSIAQRGTVVTGRVERGVVRVGDEVEIVGLRSTIRTTVTGVEMFRRLLDEGHAGDAIGVLLSGVGRDAVSGGQVLCKPGSITPHTKFRAQVYVLTRDEGGRSTPFFSAYRPQFFFRTTEVAGTITLPAGVEMVMPGDNIALEVVLQAPIALEAELRFAVREGGRTVGAGVVVAVDE